MTDNLPVKSEILVYQTEDGRVKLDVRLDNETVWLTQQMMGDLFQTSKSNISEHIKHVFEEGELNESSVVRKFRTTATDGKNYNISYYNLDVIISVGYRVKSLRGVQFRIWATQRLKEYIIKGFVMDDERLKNPPAAGSSIPDYFDEMLERIRDIRASERRMYLRVKEIFAMAGDYDPSEPETNMFFSVIQNKLHFAATGMTAAELIRDRANSSLPNMGLTSWKADEVRKTDVTIAKNYLKEEEIDGLNRIVVMWLDYAEDQAQRRKQVFMEDWERKLDEFLKFNDRQVLPDAGKVGKKEADDFARNEYDRFAERRRKYKEVQGEAATIKALEDAARQLGADKGRKVIPPDQRDKKPDNKKTIKGKRK